MYDTSPWGSKGNVLNESFPSPTAGGDEGFGGFAAEGAVELVDVKQNEELGEHFEGGEDSTSSEGEGGEGSIELYQTDGAQRTTQPNEKALPSEGTFTSQDGIKDPSSRKKFEPHEKIQVLTESPPARSDFDSDDLYMDDMESELYRRYSENIEGGATTESGESKPSFRI